MSNNTTLNQLVDFYQKEEKLLSEIFGEKEAKKPIAVKKETIENIRNYSKVLSIRPSKSILKRFEFVLN